MPIRLRSVGHLTQKVPQTGACTGTGTIALGSASDVPGASSASQNLLLLLLPLLSASTGDDEREDVEMTENSEDKDVVLSAGCDISKNFDIS